MKDGVGGDEDSKEQCGAPVASGNAVRGSAFSKRTKEGCSRPRTRNFEAPDAVGGQGVSEEIPLRVTFIAGLPRAFATCRQPLLSAGGYGGSTPQGRLP